MKSERTSQQQHMQQYSETMNIFVNHLLCIYKCSETFKYFNVGERYINVLHTRIRLGCSKLNYHLHHNLKVTDSPLCDTCVNIIEDPHHFFFVCPRYNQIRVKLLSDLSRFYQNPRLSCLLYGDRDLSDQENTIIFLAVQSFIKQSKRLQSNIQVT